jgi:hypothetical protein
LNPILALMVVCWSSAPTAATHSKTSLLLEGALRWAATTAQSAPSEVVPSLVGRLGAATLAASSQLWWTYLSCRLAAGYAGGWLVI